MHFSDDVARADRNQSASAISVLHCIATLDGGGAERQLKAVSRRLVERGFRISILSRFRPQDLEALSSEGVHCVPIRGRRNHNPGLAVDVWRTVRAINPHIVQTWLTQMDVLGGLLSGQRPKHIVSERASGLAYPSTLKNRLRRSLGMRADCVVANSRMGAEYWYPAPNVVTIPNGVDLRWIDATPSNVLARSDLLRDRKVVITVGRLSKQKQMETLVRAVAQIRADIPEILLLILGEGAERGKLQGLVEQLDLTEYVHFGGYVTDIPVWLKSAHLFASSSLYEGQPNVVLEAAAARIPMVLSDIPEHRELVGNAALYATPGKPDRFAAALMQLLRSSGQRDELIAAARAVAEGYSFDAVADAYADLYLRLAATSRRGQTGPASG